MLEFRSRHQLPQAFQLKEASTGAVTLIQRFGSALNLNIHGHLLVRDVESPADPVGGNPAYHWK